MNSISTTRRAVIAGAAGLAAFGATRGARAASAPAMPSSPVALNVIDVAGQLQLTQGAMEAYAKANPKLVSKISFSQAPAPELPGKIKAQQDAGRVDIDLVLTGTDGLAAGIDQKLWVPLVTDYAAALPKLQGHLPAGRAEDAGAGRGPGGVRGVLPGRPDHRIHAGRGEDAAEDRAGTAGLGQGAPEEASCMRVRPIPAPGAPSCRACLTSWATRTRWIPKDGWDKTWAYLVELGKNIEYYPTGTGATMKELGEGSRDIIASHLGWDLNPRILGVVPKEAQVGTLAGFPLGHRRAILGDPEGRARTTSWRCCWT